MTALGNPEREMPSIPVLVNELEATLSQINDILERPKRESASSPSVPITRDEGIVGDLDSIGNRLSNLLVVGQHIRDVLSKMGTVTRSQ